MSEEYNYYDNLPELGAITIQQHYIIPLPDGPGYYANLQPMYIATRDDGSKYYYTKNSDDYYIELEYADYYAKTHDY